MVCVSAAINQLLKCVITETTVSSFTGLSVLTAKLNALDFHT